MLIYPDPGHINHPHQHPPNTLPHQQQVGVIGGGAWGTALAAHVARMGHDTVLWAIESDVVDDINNAHENKRYLAGIPLPPTLKANTDLRAVVEHGELIVMVVPTPFVARTLQPVADAFTSDKIMVSCTKGINTETLETVNQVCVVFVVHWTMKMLLCTGGMTYHAIVAQGYTSCITHNCTSCTISGTDQGAPPCLSCTSSLFKWPILCQRGCHRPPSTNRSDSGIPQH